MKKKIDDGNSHSDWLGSLIVICIALEIFFWVENPDNSHLWNQTVWRRLGACDFSNCYRLDFCRYGTKWRKRTRFFTCGRLRGLRKICLGNHIHQVLRGRSAKHKAAWTKVAEPYPKPLCSVLAWAACSDLHLTLARGGLACKSNHRRIGCVRWYPMDLC